MDFFIIYVALPALFYRILAKTPFEQLNNVPFIVDRDARHVPGADAVVRRRFR